MDKKTKKFLRERKMRKWVFIILSIWFFVMAFAAPLNFHFFVGMLKFQIAAVIILYIIKFCYFIYLKKQGKLLPNPNSKRVVKEWFINLIPVKKNDWVTILSWLFVLAGIILTIAGPVRFTNYLYTRIETPDSGILENLIFYSYVLLTVCPGGCVLCLQLEKYRGARIFAILLLSAVLVMMLFNPQEIIITLCNLVLGIISLVLAIKQIKKRHL